MDKAVEILTIGHSTLPYDQFLTMLQNASVTAIADVRTSPYSKRFPHFNREALKPELLKSGIAYVFLGYELGGRPRDKALYCDGVADYEKMAETKAFADGINRLMDGAERFKVAMMCTEKDPLDCHRCLLVSRVLSERCVIVRHLLHGGLILGHNEIEAKLVELLKKKGIKQSDYTPENIALGYRARAMKVAYRYDKPTHKKV